MIITTFGPSGFIVQQQEANSTIISCRYMLVGGLQPDHRSLPPCPQAVLGGAITAVGLSRALQGKST
jgi:hypothetical protein